MKEPKYFTTRVYNASKNEKVKIDYYINGPKAAETRYRNGMKHQNSESYYPTGEQFRSALYFYDTLIVDLYFAKSGDTIRNFPAIEESKRVNPITIRKDSIEISFDYYDGKIIYGSYKEALIKK